MRYPKPTRAFKVWQRNLDVFKSHYMATIVGNIGEPLLYLFGVGIGLGALVNQVDGMSYMEFYAPGLMVVSAMTSASFECTFGSYTRMVEQRVFHSMLSTPLSIEDIVLGEILWGGTKAFFASSVVLAVLSATGYFHEWAAIPAIILCMVMLGLTMAGIAVTVSAVAWSYEFFNYFFTLFLTPMILFSGIYFPIGNLPDILTEVMTIFPPMHAVNINRYLFNGAGDLSQTLLDLGFLFIWMLAAGWVAAILIRRRMIPES